MQGWGGFLRFTSSSETIQPELFLQKEGVIWHFQGKKKQKTKNKMRALWPDNKTGEAGDILYPNQERMVGMKNNAPRKIVAAVAIDMDGHEARMERLAARPDGQADIRILVAHKGERQAAPLVLSEEQLIELLHRASHAGVLSAGFIGKLREKIEI